MPLSFHDAHPACRWHPLGHRATHIQVCLIQLSSAGWDEPNRIAYPARVNPQYFHSIFIITSQFRTILERSVRSRVGCKLPADLIENRQSERSKIVILIYRSRMIQRNLPMPFEYMHEETFAGDNRRYRTKHIRMRPLMTVNTSVVKTVRQLAQHRVG